MAFSIGFDIFANDRASGAFDRLGNRVENTESKFSKFSKLAVAGGLVAGAALVKFGADSVAAFKESEESQKELAFAFEKFPAMASTSQAALQALNSELQKKTKYDDDNIASGQAVLAQFKLTGQQVKDTTPLLLDYASRMGKDIPGAAQDVGKALLGNAKALKSIGITYKSTGDSTKDFANITQLMRDKVGGFAEKEATTAAGKAAILGNQFGEIQEKVGSKLVPALVSLTDAGLKVVDWLGKNETTVKNVAIGVGGFAVVLGVANLAIAAHGLALNIAAAGGLKAFIVGSKIATAGQWLWNAALSANPIGIVIVAIGLLVAAIVLIATKTTWFQTAWKAMTDALGKAWQWLWNSILAPIIRFVLGGFASITDGIASMLKTLSNIPGFGWAKTAADKMAGAADKARKLADGIRDIPDKTVTVTVFYLQSGAAAAITSANKRAGMIGQNAAGTDNWRGGPTWVGERGPEILNLPKGSQVVPNDKISTLASKDNSDVVSALKVLGDRFGAELARQARTIQTMQRQMA